MAIFKPTIFQDISGSVGNVTSYKVGKTQIARGKPGFVKDAKTPEQLKQRARLSLITKLRRRFLKVLSVGYCSPSGKVCANCFTRDNIHAYPSSKRKWTRKRDGSRSNGNNNH